MVPYCCFPVGEIGGDALIDYLPQINACDKKHGRRLKNPAYACAAFFAMLHLYFVVASAVMRLVPKIYFDINEHVNDKEITLLSCDAHLDH